MLSELRMKKKDEKTQKKTCVTWEFCYYVAMTDQEVIEQAYDTGFRGENIMPEGLTSQQQELWYYHASNGQADERDEAAAANADYHVECSIYGYDY
jgi:hypothetical protein